MNMLKIAIYITSCVLFQELKAQDVSSWIPPKDNSIVVSERRVAFPRDFRTMFISREQRTNLITDSRITIIYPKQSSLLSLPASKFSRLSDVMSAESVAPILPDTRLIEILIVSPLQIRRVSWMTYRNVDAEVVNKEISSGDVIIFHGMID